MGWPTGFEPATTSSTSLDSTIELWPPTGFPKTRSFRARRQVRRRAARVPIWSLSSTRRVSWKVKERCAESKLRTLSAPERGSATRSGRLAPAAPRLPKPSSGTSQIRVPAHPLRLAEARSGRRSSFVARDGVILGPPSTPRGAEVSRNGRGGSWGRRSGDAGFPRPVRRPAEPRQCRSGFSLRAGGSSGGNPAPRASGGAVVRR
jgi:hypothetical protein